MKPPCAATPLLVLAVALQSTAEETPRAGVGDWTRACHDISAAAEQVAGTVSDEAAAFKAVYSQCLDRRPQFQLSTGLLGIANAKADCKEFARLYRVARHYSISKHVAGEEFCSTLAPPKAKQLESSQPAAGAAVAKATQLNVEESQFVSSCVRYANKLIADDSNGSASPTAVASDVQKSCESHLSRSERGFCAGYADLVRRRATKAEIAEFCDAQFRKTKAKESSSATPKPQLKAQPEGQQQSQQSQQSAEPKVQTKAQPSPQPKPEEPHPVATAVASKPVVSAVLSGNASATNATTQEEKTCEKHLVGIEQLNLSPAEGAKIVELDCPKRFHVAASTCAEMARVFESRASHEVTCKIVMPKHVHVPGTDMMAVCKKAIGKVAGLGLEGEALGRASSDLCTSELTSLPAAVQPPMMRIRVGCHFFAKRVMEAQQRGPLDQPDFCASLAKAPGAGKHVKQQQRDHATVPATAPNSIAAPLVGSNKGSPAEQTGSFHAIAKVHIVQEDVAKAEERATPFVSQLGHEEKRAAKTRKLAVQQASSPAAPASTSAVPKLPAKSAVAAGVDMKKDKAATAGRDSLRDSLASDEDFLNGFLNSYGEKQKQKKQEQHAKVKDQVTTLFGSDVDAASTTAATAKAAAVGLKAAPPPAKTAVKGKKLAMSLVDEVAEDKDDANQLSAANGDFLASFLDSYDEGTEKAATSASAPTKPASPAAPAPEDDAAETSEPAAVQPAPEIQPQGGSDIDSLVSTFVSGL
eukprot:gnl/TRDRNA2_/TRDRNA2_185967_c0_seq1.p1 gnl/TRDRNA2_/TRDRNA2_185967_c0~~gnl/TRDRNA2_/TRDRNA2_185967_c0_seq1.p1  ORF type:complete len:754 (-),score=206.53 gnl/TRDRNA2_/TRDRNA2_185967_c0_seq1:95-2356(-)